MSSNLHPTIARDMLDQSRTAKDRHGEDETEQALNRATGRPIPADPIEQESGADKLDRAARTNDRTPDQRQR